MSQRGIRSIRVRVNRVKLNEKWDEFQEKLDLVRVSGEFELSQFEISGLYSTNKGEKSL